jgi:hypothetical protein
MLPVEVSVDDDVIAQIQSLRDVGLKWKDVGDALNISPSTLYRMRKKPRFVELSENSIIGKKIMKIYTYIVP